MSLPLLSVLVLTEDSSRQAQPTVRALARAAFKLLVPEVATNRIRFEPSGLAPPPFGMRANRWKSTGLQDEIHIRSLVRDIADFLMLDAPPGVVLFHVDGDRPWSEREESENVRKFARIILTRVEQRLVDAQPDWTPEELKVRMTRLIGFHPFWSIEAWLYQNFMELRRISDELGGEAGRMLRLQISEWEDNPTRIEDLRKPKEICVLGSDQNCRLATHSWPSKTIYGRSQSFALAVNAMLECDALTRALGR